MRDYIGDYRVIFKGNTKSLDYGSRSVIALSVIVVPLQAHAEISNTLHIPLHPAIDSAWKNSSFNPKP